MTKALVFSVDWYEGGYEKDYPHYHVVYSYHVGEDRFIGEFDDYISEQTSYLHRDDEITIRYNPELPSKSFYPDASSATNRRVLAYSIGAILAVIVMLIAYLNGTFNK